MSDDEDDSSSESPPSSHGGKLTARGGDGQGLSTEELARLQDELLALKMHHQELLQESRWLQATQAKKPAAPVQQMSAASASATMRSLTSQLSAVHAKNVQSMRTGVASLQTSLQMKSADGTISPPPASPPRNGKSAVEEQKALRAEASSLRSRIRSALEEVDEFRQVAQDARQAATSAASVSATANEDCALRRPTLEQVRTKTAELYAAAGAASMPPIADQDLEDVVDAVFQHLEARLHPNAEAGDADAEGAEDAEDEDDDEDEDRKLLRLKIKAQQEELDRLVQVFQKQQDQIVRLRDQIPGSHKTEASGSKSKEAKQVVKAKLRETEKYVETLVKQLETSEAISKQSLELRTRLRTLAEQSVQRDKILNEMGQSLTIQTASSQLFTERLRFVQEDLCGLRARKFERRGHRWHMDHSRTAVVFDHPRATSSTASPTIAERTRLESVGGSAVNRVSAMENEHRRSIGVGADLAPCLRDIEERRRLSLEVEDARVEKVVLDKRAARELRDLRALARTEEQKRQAQAAPQSSQADVPQGSTSAIVVEHHDISSDGEGDTDVIPFAEEGSDEVPTEQYPAALVHVQRVSELEERTDALRDDLEQLHRSERALRAEIKEKNELIAHLMRKAKLVDFDGGATSTNVSSNAVGAFWALVRQGDPERDTKELQRVIEETTEDNIRLRNDVQIMAEELRKALAAVDAAKTAASPKKHVAARSKSGEGPK